MYCLNCGKQVTEGAKFCTGCGMPLRGYPYDSTDPEDIVQNNLPATNQPASSPGSSKPQDEPGTSNGLPNSQGPSPMPAGPAHDGPAPTKKRKKSKAVKALILSGVILAIVACLSTAFVLLDGVDKVTVAWQMHSGNRFLTELDYESAIVAFQKVIEIEPSNVQAYINLADAYVGLEDYKTAIKVLDNGIRETDSDELREHKDEVQELWNDAIRCITGYVYAVDTDLDDSNNDGIRGASVDVTGPDGKTRTYTTGRDGSFKTDVLAKGKYTLHYHVDGYVECTQEMDLQGGIQETSVYLEPDGVATLYGSVLTADEDTDYSNNYPLNDASISLRKLTGTNPFETSTTTDPYGQYQVPNLLMGVYELVVSKEGFITVTQTVIIYEGQSISYNTLIEAIGTQWTGVGNASGTIYDALTGRGVSGLTLSIRHGINNTSGTAIDTFETQSDGSYLTPDLESGNYCLQITDNRSGVEERYLETSINVKILGGINIPSQDGTVSNTLQAGQVRIVLTWGATPNDLDSHLWCRLENGSQTHIFFGNRTFSPGSQKVADLDLDDVDCYGPETTTIYRDDPGEYTFGVYNYTHGGLSQLAGSRACVQVYMGNSLVPSYVFYVPNQGGYYWEVFRYSTSTGILTPINTMSSMDMRYDDV